MRQPHPKALFDTIENFSVEVPDCVKEFIESIPLPNIRQEYELTRLFLESYAGSKDTFNAYRKEVERFLQWSWLVAQKPVQACDRHDIRLFLEFAQKPPKQWISTKSSSRFIDSAQGRVHNPDWRPFNARISKTQTRLGMNPEKADFRLGNSALQALVAGLSTYFTFLLQENYTTTNPVQLVRQKNRYLQKQQSHKVTRKLSELQWVFTIETIQSLANDNPRYERHLFLLSAFYLLGLRISELADTPGRIPTMGDFAPDKNDRWWFSTVGKGNKVRDVAVPDDMLIALQRYRKVRGLSPLPTRGETTSLIHKERGGGGLTTRQIRNLVQECFDFAILQLTESQKLDAANDLASATVHWLRHTAISSDVEHRPLKDVRDDAGHENAAITDRYIDSDRTARHLSAKDKSLIPLMKNEKPSRSEPC